jgi:hypothetical protein
LEYLGRNPSDASRRNEAALQCEHALQDLVAVATRLSEAIEDGDHLYALDLADELQRRMDQLAHEGRTA